MSRPHKGSCVCGSPWEGGQVGLHLGIEGPSLPGSLCRHRGDWDLVSGADVLYWASSSFVSFPLET